MRSCSWCEHGPYFFINATAADAAAADAAISSLLSHLCYLIGAISFVAVQIGAAAFKAVSSSYAKVATKQAAAEMTHTKNTRSNKRTSSSRSQSQTRDFAVNIPSGDLSSMPQPRR